MTDQIIRDFQSFTSNPSNSNEDCFRMFNQIVAHFINPVIVTDFDKMQIRKAAITIANNRRSVYPKILGKLQLEHPAMFAEFKLPSA